MYDRNNLNNIQTKEQLEEQMKKAGLLVDSLTDSSYQRFVDYMMSD